ncbi:MAG: NAD(P)/FAD-dependent oxidoreductase [Desulfobacterales bacterium]
MKEQAFDVIILGAGPAGFQAALHAVRRKASVLLLGKAAKSSAHGSHIENFCCIHGTSGTEMLKLASEQARKAGAVVSDEDVIDVETVDGRYAVYGERGGKYTAAAIVLAMGISRNSLKLPGEKKLIGRGISYCVDCDGPLFKNEPVAVVGCESAAGSGALTLMFFTPEVHLICEALHMDDYLAEKIKSSDIRLHEGRKVTHITGETELAGIALDDGTKLDIKGMFIELGAKGAVGLAGKLGVRMDEENMKYVAVTRKQETNLPGVYAAGDICGPPWQVAKAVGEGCVAGLEAAAYARKPKSG